MPHARDVSGDFAGWKLAAFPRLCPLRYFDFQFVRMDKIFGGDSEACGGYLLHTIVCFSVAIILRILSALTCVTASAQAIHGDCKRTVSLTRDCTQRHGLSAEAAQDCAVWFHFI